MKLSELQAPTKLSDVQQPELSADVVAQINQRYPDPKKPAPSFFGDDFKEGFGADSYETDLKQAQLARQRATKIEQIRLKNPVLAEEIERAGGLEAFAVGAGEGFHTLGRGVGLLDEQDPVVKEALSGLSAQQPGAFGAGEVLAEATPFMIPGTLAAKLSNTGWRALAMSGIGATEGNIISRGKGGGGNEILLSTILGGAIPGGVEVAAPVVSRVAGGIIRRLRGQPPTGPVISETGALSPELIEALDGAGISPDDFAEAVRREMGNIQRQSPEDIVNRQLTDVGPEGAAQTARRQTFQDAGLTGEAAPTRAQVERTKELFTDQELLARKSNLVNRRLEAQNAAMQGRFDEAIQATEGSIGHGGATAGDAIRNKALDLDEQIGAAYRAAREAAPTARSVGVTEATQSLQQLAPRNQVSNGVVKAIYGHMQQQGLVGKRFTPQGRISVQQAEELRQYANSLYDGANAQGREIIRQFKSALDNDVARVSPDIFRDARRAKAQYEADIRRTATDKLDRRRTSLIRDVIDNKLDSGQLMQQVIVNRGRYRPDDLEHLRNYLHSGNQEQRLAGEIAWNDLRAETLDYIRREATRGGGGENEVREITAAGLNNVLKKIDNRKLEILFTAQERALLDTLVRVANLRTPPPGTFLGGGPTALAVDGLANKLGMFGGLFDVVKTHLDSRHLLRLENLAESLQRRRANRLRQLLPSYAATAPAVAVASSEE